jgi:hypothetical protein
MKRWVRKSVFLAAISVIVFLLAASTAAAPEGDLLWSQPWNGSSAFGPSVLWNGTYDQEIADDFELTGLIERIYAGGNGCFQCQAPVVDGVYVRFYEHTESGPGALQAEYFLAGDDPNFVYDPAEPSDLDITLPTPFAASGKHFVSVQMVMAGYWDWWESNPSAPNLSRIYVRDNLAGSDWEYYDFVGYGNADVVFDLYGQLSAGPQVYSLSHTTLDRSGRLRIFGANFGEEVNGGQVLIDGVPAIISRWEGNSINAYVPESAGPGPVTVQVITGLGGSNEMTLDVTLRQADGRLQWRFQADGLYALARPVVGPDGTIYAVDVYGSLYALSPDGGLKFIVPGAGGKGVDVGSDGTIYTGDENQVMAVNPDGSVKWVFEQEPRAFILLGPNVGPDGNIYGVASSGIGVFSLTPNGDLRWTYPEPYDRPITDYQELKFGYNGDTLQMYHHANDRFRAFTADGELAWEYGPFAGSGNPEVGPDQTIYNQAIQRYDPDGNIINSFTPPTGSGATAPHVAAATGNVYHVTSLATLRSLTPDLTQRWERFTGLILSNPYPDPTDQVVVMSGAENFGMSGYMLGMDTSNGAELWRVPFPGENGLMHVGGSNPRFTADGSTVYMNTLFGGAAGGDEFWYLYAVDTGLTPNEPPAAGEDDYAVAANGALVVDAPGLLANDVDPEGQTLTAELVGGPAHGTLSLAVDGSFVYTPAADFVGSDSFMYRVSDGVATSGLTTVHIEVGSVLPPPDGQYSFFLPMVVR